MSTDTAPEAAAPKKRSKASKAAAAVAPAVDQQASAPAPSLKKTTYQTGEIRTVKRSVLLNAPYNPRGITPHAKRKLRDSIKRFGEFDRVVWNERSGNLVAGHQRITALDELEGTGEYAIEVLVVNVDEKTEREMNVAHNNPSIQGHYDMDLLAGLLPEIDFERAGFDKLDLEMMFEDAGLPNVIDKIITPEAAAAQAKVVGQIDSIQAEADDIAKAEKESKQLELIKQRRAAYNAEATTENEDNFFVTIVFRSNKEKFAVMEFLGVQNKGEAYVSGDILASKLGFTFPPEPD